MQIDFERDEDWADCWYVWAGDRYAGYLRPLVNSYQLDFHGEWNLNQQLEIVAAVLKSLPQLTLEKK